jgi:hypothetical protein
MVPRYNYPPFAFFRLAPNVLFGGRRSFRRDSQLCIERLEPPLRVYGAENIPQTGPALITFNHYYRPGFQAWWMALALAAVIPEEMHFVVTGELTYPGKWYAPLGEAGSRWLLRQLSHVYGFTPMPPMPPRPKDVEARARSVRETLTYARKNPHAIIGLAPEGGDNVPTGALTWPASGAGRFISLLAAQRFPIVPMGAYEEAGEFCLSFGAAYRLKASPRALSRAVPRELGADEKDRAAAEIVMSTIAAQLPPRLRGPFA